MSILKKGLQYRMSWIVHMINWVRLIRKVKKEVQLLATNQIQAQKERTHLRESQSTAIMAQMARFMKSLLSMTQMQQKTLLGPRTLSIPTSYSLSCIITIWKTFWVSANSRRRLWTIWNKIWRNEAFCHLQEISILLSIRCRSCQRHK